MKMNESYKSSKQLNANDSVEESHDKSAYFSANFGILRPVDGRNQDLQDMSFANNK
jgi:hypothetical protein